MCWRWFITILAGLVGCTNDRLGEPLGTVDPTWRTIYLPALASSFVVPADWQTQELPQQIIFKGPEHSHTQFITLQIQWGASTDMTVDGALQGSFSLLDDHSTPLFTNLVPVYNLDHLAMAYTVQFTWQETQRRHTGLLAPIGANQWFHLHYGAPEAFFSKGLGVFLAMQDGWMSNEPLSPTDPKPESSFHGIPPTEPSDGTR